MAQTIDEYLITLGLKVDKAAEQRFNSALGNLGKTLSAIAAGLTGAAAAIQATVVAVSKSFDNLYFASQRTHASVGNLKALSYAFTQIGASGGEAQAAVEAVARALRTNPGNIPWLNGQGIATKGRDMVDITIDSIKQFSKLNYAAAHQFAANLGWGEDLFNKLYGNTDKILSYMEEVKKTYAKFGVDPEQAAKSSNELMSRFRNLTMELGTLLEKITVALQPQLNQIMKDVGDWFEKHQNDIVSVLDSILKAVKDIAIEFIAFAKNLPDIAGKILEIAKRLTGDENSLSAILKVLTVTVLGAFIAQWGVLLATLAANPAFWALVGLTATGAGVYKLFTATDAEWAEAARLAGATPSGDAAGIGGAAGKQSWVTRNIINPVRKALGAGAVDDTGKPSGGGSSSPRAGLAPVKTKDGRVAWVPAEGAAQFQGFINDLEAQGYSIDDVQGFNDRDVRGRPGVKSAHGKEGAIDVNPSPNNPWDTTKPLPPNVSELAKKWGLGWGGNWRSRKDTPHFSLRPGEGGRVLSPEELKALQDEQAKTLKDKQSELFGAPGLGSSSARLASISNRTSITVYGSSDPAGTAANLSGAQSRVASELIRNGQSAFV